MQIKWFLLLLMIANAFSQSATYQGESPISNISPEEARNRAIQQTRLNAIEQNCGVQMQSEEMVRDYMLSGDFIRSLSYGHVMEEKIINESVLIDQPAKDQPPHLTYQVTMQLTVRCENGQPDPAFQISLDVNKKTYISGDELVLRFKSTQECHLTLVDFSPDGRIYLFNSILLPRDNLIAGQTAIEIPNSQKRQSGLRLALGLPTGMTSASEAFLAIATKSQVPFLEVNQNADGLLDNITITGTQLMRWLSNIPVSERAEAQVMIEIHER